MQRIRPGVFPSSILFDTTPIWIHIHDLPVDWRVDAIVRRSAGFMSVVLEVDKFSV